MAGQVGATTAFDVRYGTASTTERGLWRALEDVRPDRTYVVHAGDASWRMRGGVEARSVLELPDGGAP